MWIICKGHEKKCILFFSLEEFGNGKKGRGEVCVGYTSITAGTDD